MTSRTVRIRSGSDLGLALQQARLQAGLTQEQLASRSALDRTYLARLESGGSVLMLDRAIRLLRQLGAEVTVSLAPLEPTDRTADAPGS